MNTRQDTSLNSTDDALMARARKRVAMKLGFFNHALVFVMVNFGLFLFADRIFHGRGVPFPMMGWALGLAIHGVTTFFHLQGDGWRDRMLAQEVTRLRERA